MNDLNDPQFRKERILILQKEIRTYENYLNIISNVGGRLNWTIQQLDVDYGSPEKRFAEMKRNLILIVKDLESMTLEYQMRIKDAEFHIISLKAYTPLSNSFNIKS